MPKLRFPEFNGEWKEKKLKDISFLNPKSHNYPDKFNYIDLESVESGVLKKKQILKKEEAPSRAQRVLENEDILFQTVRPYQKNNLFFNVNDSEDYIASTGYAQIRAKEDAEFLYHSLHTDWFVNDVLAKCTGTSYPAINSNDLGKIRIKFPSISEQQKISSFLSKVDEKIEKLEKKQELWETYKKGMIQQIFSQKLRFKDENGEEYPDWEEKRLGDFSKKVKEKNKDNLIDDIVFSNSAVNGLVLQKDFFDKDIANKNNLSGYYIVKNGFFVYNPRISNFAPVGPVNINKTGLIGLVSPLYTVFDVKDNNVNISFLELFFSTKEWHQYMRSVANYGARHDRMNITDKDFFKMPIRLPSTNEQSKIANFLYTVDNKTKNVKTELKLNKKFKKGLLQQIFC